MAHRRTLDRVALDRWDRVHSALCRRSAPDCVLLGTMPHASAQCVDALWSGPDTVPLGTVPHASARWCPTWLAPHASWLAHRHRSAWHRATRLCSLVPHLVGAKRIVVGVQRAASPRRCLTSRRPHCVVPPQTVGATPTSAASIRPPISSALCSIAVGLGPDTVPLGTAPHASGRWRSAWSVPHTQVYSASSPSVGA